MDRMASAEAAKGESRTRVLQEVSVVPSALAPSHLLMVYTPVVHQEERGYVRTFRHSSVRYSQFKVVHIKQNSILDIGHPTRWVNSTTEREDTALEGQDWHSEVYVFPLLCLTVPYIRCYRFTAQCQYVIMSQGISYPLCASVVSSVCIRHTV